MYKIIYILIGIFGFTTLLSAKNIKFTPEEFFTTGYRINIDSIIEEKSGIYEARVYFKGFKNKKYTIYSPMSCRDSYCRALLPIPKKTTRNIYYKIVYQNNIGKVFVTKEFVMQKREILELPKHQSKNREKFTLFTDLLKAPTEIFGFEDNFEIKTIQKSRKIGVIAKIIEKEVAGVIDEKKEINAVFDSQVGAIGKDGSILPAVLGALLLFLLL